MCSDVCLVMKINAFGRKTEMIEEREQAKYRKYVCLEQGTNKADQAAQG